MEPVPDTGSRLGAHTQRLALLLHHLAGRAVRTRVEVDDLVQEVYLRALQTELPPYDPERPHDPELYGLLKHLARNTVVDVARALRARKRDAREAPLVRSDWSHFGQRESRIGDVAPGPATRAAAREESDRVRHAFAGLAPDHQRVIGLRQFEGLTAAEAARRLGRSEVAVHSLYRRALEAWERAVSTGC